MQSYPALAQSLAYKTANPTFDQGLLTFPDGRDKGKSLLVQSKAVSDETSPGPNLSSVVQGACYSCRYLHERV